VSMTNGKVARLKRLRNLWFKVFSISFSISTGLKKGRICYGRGAIQPGATAAPNYNPTVKMFNIFASKARLYGN